MAHKVQPCNQHSSSVPELPFGELMQKAFKPTQDGKPDSATRNLNTSLLKMPTNFVKEKQLKKAWDGLNRDQRELLALYVAEGLSCAQIAERKQQSHASIRRALSNVYARLLLQVEYA